MPSFFGSCCRYSIRAQMTFLPPYLRVSYRCSINAVFFGACCRNSIRAQMAFLPPYLHVSYRCSINAVFLALAAATALEPRWPFYHLIYILYSTSDTALSSTTTFSRRFTSESRCRSLAECHWLLTHAANSASQIQNKHTSIMETNDWKIYRLHSQ